MRFQAPTPMLSRPVRVCCIQYCLRPVKHFDEFAEQVETYVDVGDDYDADILVFPELLAAQLLSCLPEAAEATAMHLLAERYSAPFEKLFQKLAKDYDRILVAGTHPRLVGEKLLNVASVFVPGQPPVHQPKLHLTPTERKVWGFSPGQEIHVIETDFGRFAASVCYDVQFPEVGRILSEQGVQLLLVPFLTDDRRGCNRVNLCARARAIENQFYVATAGMIGSLPLITDLTAQYALSGVYTPSDFPFPMDGLATEAAPNTEMVLVADLDLALLDRARERGSVLNYQDAASDGLHVVFDGQIRLHYLPWITVEAMEAVPERSTPPALSSGGTGMPKTIITPDQDRTPALDVEWLNLEGLAEVEITSEDPAHPIEEALLPGGTSGWRAASPGKQTIRLLFRSPQRLQRIWLHFQETRTERTQEYVLRWSTKDGRSLQDIVRQRWHFSPLGATSETEDHHVDLLGVTVLELEIQPDTTAGDACASLARLRLA